MQLGFAGQTKPMVIIYSLKGLVVAYLALMEKWQIEDQASSARQRAWKVALSRSYGISIGLF